MGRDGSIYVADGYCNSRIVQYSPQGQYQWEYRLLEGQSVLSVPHSLALHECKGLLYVADREGAVVHAFELGSGDVHGKAHAAGTGCMKAGGATWCCRIGLVHMGQVKLPLLFFL